MDRILSFISLAQKAGKVQAGEFLTMKALKEGMAWAVVVAEDASDKTKSRMAREGHFFECDVFSYASKEALGRFTGNRDKSMLCITDEGFSKSLAKMLEGKQLIFKK